MDESKRRMLIVEDNESVASFAKREAEKSGVEAVSVANREDAEVAIKDAEGWTFLVLDGRFPDKPGGEKGSHGYQLLKEWHQKGLLPRIVLANSTSSLTSFEILAESLIGSGGGKEGEPGGGVEIRVVQKHKLPEEIRDLLGN